MIKHIKLTKLNKYFIICENEHFTSVITKPDHFNKKIKSNGPIMSWSNKGW